MTFADLELDEDSHEVRRGGRVIDVSPTEFKLLRYLMLNPNRVLSKAQILDHVWDYDFRGESGIVESYISYLRRKIDAEEPAADPHQARRRLRAAPAARVRMTAASATADCLPARARRGLRAGASSRSPCGSGSSPSCWCCCSTALTLTGLTTIFLMKRSLMTARRPRPGPGRRPHRLARPLRPAAQQPPGTPARRTTPCGSCPPTATPSSPGRRRPPSARAPRHPRAWPSTTRGCARTSRSRSARVDGDGRLAGGRRRAPTANIATYAVAVSLRQRRHTRCATCAPAPSSSAPR